MTETDRREENQLRSVALQNANTIHAARIRDEQELRDAKRALEAKTEELARSLAMVRATLESTTDGILVTDAEAKITGFNQRFVEMFDFPPAILEERRHQSLLEVVRRRFADPDHFMARVKNIYGTSPPESYDLLEFRDGTVYERYSRLQIVDDGNVGGE